MSKQKVIWAKNFVTMLHGDLFGIKWHKERSAYRLALEFMVWPFVLEAQVVRCKLSSRHIAPDLVLLAFQGAHYASS